MHMGLSRVTDGKGDLAQLQFFAAQVGCFNQHANAQPAAFAFQQTGAIAADLVVHRNRGRRQQHENQPI